MCFRFLVMDSQFCNANYFDVHFLYLNMLHIHVKIFSFFVMHMKKKKIIIKSGLNSCMIFIQNDAYMV